MTSDIKSILNTHLTNTNSGSTSKGKIPVAQVDELADSLVSEYQNPKWRQWYCGVINKFGVEKVMEWRRRAAEGKSPGRLFSVYVNQSGGYKQGDTHVR